MTHRSAFKHRLFVTVVKESKDIQVFFIGRRGVDQFEAFVSDGAGLGIGLQQIVLVLHNFQRMHLRYHRRKQ